MNLRWAPTMIPIPSPLHPLNRVRKKEGTFMDFEEIIRTYFEYCGSRRVTVARLSQTAQFSSQVWRGN
ncbi:putative malate:quinone oxidoreductase [Frankliniella fusca]|uniref:Malate:quinone oxidoreductase n=1 Tax=Frankliniella fusca TaxID=407009 RepID=A0AAE1HZW8_9NEOP|nr:putative malate:quinone oxidoreductase [Frankliniella fusca]